MKLIAHTSKSIHSRRGPGVIHGSRHSFALRPAAGREMQPTGAQRLTDYACRQRGARRLHKSLMVSGLHFTLEAVAEAEEEVVGGFRVADLETDVEEEALSDEGLEGGDIVEAA